ncbi:hypothetical protein H072_10717 [Dactylellina haptotyla CBS 200.50]|uniref:Uncharacterized protein n=1 Tax=Dactylellina haptotyla (strain CBS 200.50) TaxID=1284197 RepID=S7ZYF3_DACHA|nr:hypothetical protein H072_10717 [Dactylellina haptotyla CBS 200.50]
MSEQSPPPIVPQITHTPSPQPPPSPTSSSCSSIATEDISDSGEESPAIMESSELDYLTHGDLRSPGREFARERSLRKKGPHRHTSSTSIPSTPTALSVQPQYPSEDEENKKNLTPEERTKARKKAKKTAKAEKRKALKSQETPKNPRKREDRRREDEVAAVEASMAALRTTDEGEDVQTQPSSADITTTPDRQRRRSSNTLARPAKPRKTSSSGQAGAGSAGGAGAKSPKLGVDPEDPANLAKRGSPGYGNKQHAAFTQYHVEEGIHERSNDIDSQMAALAQFEAMRELSRGGKLARGLEELEKRKMKQKQNEALKGVVEAAQERYEDEKLAKFYGLK